MTRAVALTWDWRQQPDWERLAVVVLDLSGGRVHLRLVDTGSDEYALVVADRDLTEQQATRVFDRWAIDGQTGDLFTINEGDLDG